MLLRVALLPGIVVHEAAHHLVCDIFGLSVRSSSYFSFRGRPGYVRHEKPSGWLPTVFVSLAPLGINWFVALFSLQYVVSFHRGSGPIALVLAAVLYWIGISAAACSIPSREDVHSIRDATTARIYRWPLLVFVGPLMLLVGGTHRSGTYRLFVPLSVLFAFAFTVGHGLPLSTILGCLGDGAWGCWEADVGTLRVLEAAVDVLF